MTTDRGQRTVAFLHGDIVTMDDALPQATGLVAVGEQIVAVGDADDLARALPPDAGVVDLEGRTVLPGFVDGHCHLEMSATHVAYAVHCFTPPLTSLEDICRAVAERVAAIPEGTWVVGRGNFAMYRWVAERRNLTRDDLDRVAPVHPVVVFSGLHAATLNTEALRRTGLLTDPPPQGATLDVATGRATELWDKLPLPEPSVEDIATAVEHFAIERFVARGVTSIAEIPFTRAGIVAFQRMRRAGTLPTRLRLWFHVPRLADIDDLIAAGYEADLGDPWLSVGGVKLFVDGAGYDVWGNEAPSADRQWPQDELDEVVWKAHAAGLQLLLHVAPTRVAAEMALGALKRALERTPRADHRHRIEHVGDMRPDVAFLERMRALGVTATATAQFLYSSPEDSCAPLRTLHAMGFRVPGNSDCTGTQAEAANPFHGIWCAVAHRSKDGTVVLPEERIEVDAALRMYTADAAWASRMDDRGVLSPGRLADLVVLGADPRRVPVDELPELPVDRTVLGGETVWMREPQYG